MVPSYTADSTVLNASVQASKASSILNTYKSLIKIRKESPALSKGDLTAIDFKNKSVLGFTRMSKDQTVLVLHNVGKEKVSIDLPKTLVGYSNVLFKMRAKKTKDGGIELSANGSVVLTD